MAVNYDYTSIGRDELINICKNYDKENEELKEENKRWVVIIKELESRAELAVQVLRKGVKNV